MESTINAIIESAILWISEDADNPATPPEDWQRAIPLLKAAPALGSIWIFSQLDNFGWFR